MSTVCNYSNAFVENAIDYVLKWKDVSLLYFSSSRKEVRQASIIKGTEKFLPLPLKRILHYQNEFIWTGNEKYYQLNEEGCWLLDMWISDREIPISRDNYEKYIARGKTARQWMLGNHAMSFTDCYWVDSDNLCWKDIVHDLDDVDEFYSVKDSNNMYKGHNSTLGGELEKFWFKENSELYICKKINPQYDILVAREKIASLIYQKQGYKNYCDYELIYNHDNKLVGCKCKAFINQNRELITAYDLLEEYNYTQQDNLYELIVDCAREYGLDEQITKDYLDLQIIVDYLITNRDRHLNNIGFIRDVSTMQLISPAPIFDSGSSKHLESKYPEGLNSEINSMCSSEKELLSCVNNYNIIDIQNLPDVKEIERILNNCESLSLSRKDRLLNLYTNKIKVISDLQSSH